MEGERPRFVDRAALEALLGDRIAGAKLTGLYVLGALEALCGPAVAIVGTRAPSEAGRRLASRLARELGAAGVCVVSGLALGIDAAAHRGALAAGAPTVGVLGGGHDRFYPRANRGLAAEMVRGGGAVASPFPPEAEAYPGQFLQRNAVIAGLADAVVVVEAAVRSGALNTAAWAADAGKPVLAFPGDVDRPKVAGCLALIRDGAVLVRDTADVLAALPGVPADASRRRGPEVRGLPPKNPLERRILGALREGEAGLDALCARTGAEPGQILAALAALELAGTVARGDELRYALAGP